MQRVNLVPGKALGSKWLFCNLCAIQVRRENQVAHDADLKHADLLGRFTRQLALDKVIPMMHDDRHYGLFEPDAFILGV